MSRFKVSYQAITATEDGLLCAEEYRTTDFGQAVHIYRSSADLLASRPEILLDDRQPRDGLTEEWRRKNAVMTPGTVACTASIVLPDDPAHHELTGNSGWGSTFYVGRAARDRFAWIELDGASFILHHSYANSRYKTSLDFDTPRVRHSMRLGTISIDPRFGLTPEDFQEDEDRYSKVFFHEGKPCVYNYARDTLHLIDSTSEDGYHKLRVRELLQQHTYGLYPDEWVVECAICSSGDDLIVATAFDSPRTPENFRLEEATRIWSISPGIEGESEVLGLFSGPAFSGPVQMEYFDGMLCILDLTESRLNVLDLSVR